MLAIFFKKKTKIIHRFKLGTNNGFRRLRYRYITTMHPYNHGNQGKKNHFLRFLAKIL